MKFFMTAWGIEWPSNTGTVWVTPSPESQTRPVVRPLAYRERTAWMATWRPFTLKVSNTSWVIFSRLALGLPGASVRRMLCSEGSIRSSLLKQYSQTFSISSQEVTIPEAIGYLRLRTPLIFWASSPMYSDLDSTPTICLSLLGYPTIDGNLTDGWLSPEKPALMTPDPLSITIAFSPSIRFEGCFKF